MMNGEKSITTLSNIGDSRRRAFERVGVSTLSDLARYYPRAYQNRGNTLTLSEIKERLINDEVNCPYSCILTVATEPNVKMIRRGMTLLKFRAFDENGTCEITYFNQNYLKDTFHTGASFRFFGKFTLVGHTLQLSSPISEPYIEGRELLPIVPVYPLTSGITQKIVSTAVSESLKKVLPECAEMLPQDILKEASLPTSAYALKNIHFPDSEEALEAAKRRLIFDELLISSTALALSGGRRRTKAAAVMADIDTSLFELNLPYTLTDAQRRSVLEITHDMSSGYAMNRMLTGDVGSGKTVVAAAAAYISLKNGYDCLFMVPTEILANQHYNDLKELFAPFGYDVCLLTGNVTGAARREVLRRLSSLSSPTLVIGTHALLSPEAVPASLGLVIIDEQHRFGAMQRAALADKSEGISTLVMSATPIPRSLSLVMCGTLDISRIDELPAGRQKVDTFAVTEDYRVRLNGFIKKQVDEGHQVYVVCPSIEENKDKKNTRDNPEEYADILLWDEQEESWDCPLKAAEKYAEDLSVSLPTVNIAVVHGKMKPNVREEIMSRFCRGEIDVLVSTTVIEVGVNVPNATLMVVENAERFGLSQLHQLRGRVGRGRHKSYFILVSDTKNEKSRERLMTIKRCSNGYEIAEEDLRQRGPGDLFSENGIMRQHGKSSLVLAARCTDQSLFALANDMTMKILSRDPYLDLPEHRLIKSSAEKFLGDSASTMN